jgi:ABC-type multidrug transport system fused ATPase/permease subunit
MQSHWSRGSGVFLAGERLTYRIRHDVFYRVLHQPAGWFDDKAHAKSKISHALAVDAARVRDLVGDFTSIMLLIFVTLFGGAID